MNKLIEVMKSLPDFYAEKAASSSQIEQAEKALGLKFAPDFKECLRAFGAVSFDGHELTGFSADKALDVVDVTQKNRQKINIDKSFYVIEEAHIDGIVIWQSKTGEVYQSTPNGNVIKIFTSLLEYIEK